MLERVPVKQWLISAMWMALGVAAGIAIMVGTSIKEHLTDGPEKPDVRASVPLDEPPRHEMTIEEEKAARLKEWKTSLAAHSAEPVDEKWAKTTQSQFAEDVTQAAGTHGAQHLRTECRTQTCTSVVRWDSYDEGVANYISFIHRRYQQPCGRATHLPEPAGEDADSHYDMTLLFTCPREGSKALPRGS